MDRRGRLRAGSERGSQAPLDARRIDADRRRAPRPPQARATARRSLTGRDHVPGSDREWGASGDRSVDALGLAGGLPLGMLCARVRAAKDTIGTLALGLQALPSVCWVPLAILMFSGYETPVIFLATLASLFVTTLNTMLGVQSIDEVYFRAAGCLGSRRWDVFRHVVVPGALPFIFTGLQISIGVAWLFGKKRPAGFVNQDIMGFDVSVNDAFSMGVCQAASHRNQPLDSLE